MENNQMSSNKRMDKLWLLHTTGPAVKRNELLIQASAQMNFQNITWSKRIP